MENINKEIKSEESGDEAFCTTPEIPEIAENVNSELLPFKSRERYESAYITYVKWQASKNIKLTSENVLRAYFKELAEKYKPPTLWSTWSMLKSTIRQKEGIDISQFKQLTTFLKRQSDGYKGKTSKVLSSQDVETFLKKAPVNKYLATKVALIFGICGACRTEELAKLKVNNVQHQGDIILVKIPGRKTRVPRTFVIEDKFCQIVMNYESLRPPNVPSDRYFLNYRNGRCSSQVIGKNKFGAMPKQIAEYLNLPNPSLYTGHSFRRTSATLLAHSGADLITLKRHCGLKSRSVAERYVEDSINKKRKYNDHMITSTISMAPTTSKALSSSTSLSTASALSISPASSTIIEPKILSMKEIEETQVIATTSETIDIVSDSTVNIEIESPNPIFQFHNCNVNIHYQK